MLIEIFKLSETLSTKYFLWIFNFLHIYFLNTQENYILWTYGNILETHVNVAESYFFVLSAF